VAAEKGRRRRRRRRRLGIQNQKQEPHTKLWGNKEELGEGGGVLWNQCGLRVFWGGEMKRAW